MSRISRDLQELRQTCSAVDDYWQMISAGASSAVLAAQCHCSASGSHVPENPSYSAGPWPLHNKLTTSHLHLRFDFCWPVCASTYLLKIWNTPSLILHPVKLLMFSGHVPVIRHTHTTTLRCKQIMKSFECVCYLSASEIIWIFVRF